MPLLTEQELERIEEDTRQEIAGECGRLGLDDVEALIASHRQQGALIKELAEELRACVSILGIAVEANVTGAHTIRERARAALSKVPR
jgi:hypothetical protein